MRLFLSVAFVLTGLTFSYAQEKEAVKVKKSKTEITASGRKLLVHIVEKGQTLYAISREYEVPVNEIIAENPDAINGIKPGQQLLIPTKDSRKKDITLTRADSARFQFHKVEPGETLYSLTKKYNLKKDELKINNPELEQGMRTGMTLKIPLPENQIRQLPPVPIPAPAPVVNEPKPDYNIGLMLPFYLTKNDSLIEANAEGIYPRSSIAIQFYEGVLIAVDSLNRKGVSAKMFVYDSGNDSATIAALLKKPEMKELDLIIGPLYLSGSAPVADFGKQNNIPVVAPLIQQNKLLLGNPYISKVTPSMISQAEELAFYIAENHKDDNIMIIHNGNQRDKNVISIFRKKADQLLLAANPTRKDTIRELTFFKKVSNLSSTFSPSKKNVIVILSTEQAFVTDIIMQLHNVRVGNDLTVYGTEMIADFENLDPVHLQNLNFHFVSPVFIDYNDPAVTRFTNEFYKMMKTDPDKFAFYGYDIIMHYMELLYQHGPEGIVNLDKYPATGLQTGFRFYRTGAGNGFENKFAYILKFEDLNVIKKYSTK